MKSIKSLLLVTFGIAVTLNLISCNYLKSKFAKKETVVQDSFLLSLDPTANVVDSANATNAAASAGSSTEATAATATTASTTAANTSKTAPVITESKKVETASAKATTANTKITSSNDASVANTSETSTSNSAPKARTGRSSSIYDGVNDAYERSIVRRAEGYTDPYYVDEFTPSYKKSYENRYLSASDLGNGTPKSKYTPDGKLIGGSSNTASKSSSTSTASTPTRNTANRITNAEALEDGNTPEPKKTGTSHMGDYSAKDAKPATAEEMTKKKK